MSQTFLAFLGLYVSTQSSSIFWVTDDKKNQNFTLFDLEKLKLVPKWVEIFVSFSLARKINTNIEVSSKKNRFFEINSFLENL